MKIEFSRQIFGKEADIKFHEDQSSGSRVVSCGRTDRYVVVLHSFAAISVYRQNRYLSCDPQWTHKYTPMAQRTTHECQTCVCMCVYVCVVCLCVCVCVTSFFPLWLCGPTRAMASSFLRFLDHTQRRITSGRTPLDKWSARRRDLYLTKHDTHNKRTSLSPVGFEPMISADERPQTYTLDCAAAGTGGCNILHINILLF